MKNIEASVDKTLADIDKIASAATRVNEALALPGANTEAEQQALTLIREKTEATAEFGKELEKIDDKTVKVKAEVDIASIDAAAKIFEAVMGTISTGMESTGTTMTGLAQLFPEQESSADKKRLTDAFDQDAIRRDKVFSQSFKMGEQQIKLTKLQIEERTPAKTFEEISLDKTIKEFGSLTKSSNKDMFRSQKLLADTTRQFGVSPEEARKILSGEIRPKFEESKGQQDLIKSQTRLADAKQKAVESGDAMITISGDGLEPELEAFMWQILERIQIRANADGAEYLLGTT